MLRGARTKTVIKAFKEHNVQKTFDATPCAQKMKNASARANLNDFERFQVMLLRKRRSNAIAGKLKKVIKK